jgi:hypothetical protein
VIASYGAAVPNTAGTTENSTETTRTGRLEIKKKFESTPPPNIAQLPAGIDTVAGGLACGAAQHTATVVTLTGAALGFGFSTSITPPISLEYPPNPVDENSGNSG